MMIRRSKGFLRMPMMISSSSVSVLLVKDLMKGSSSTSTTRVKRIQKLLRMMNRPILLSRGSGTPILNPRIRIPSSSSSSEPVTDASEGNKTV